MSIHASDALGTSQVGVVGTDWLYIMDRDAAGGEIDIAWFYFGQPALWTWIGQQKHGVLAGDWFHLRDVMPNACFELTGIHSPISASEIPGELILRGPGGSITATAFGGAALEFSWADGVRCGSFSVGDLVEKALGKTRVRG